MIKTLIGAVGFWWSASAGHRLHPWRSEYLRWRVETYTGQPANTVRLRDFLRLAWSERRQMGRFFRWSSQLKALSAGKNP